MQEPIKSSPAFDSGHERARWATYLFIATIIIAIISIVSSYMQIELLSKAMKGETITEGEAEANDSRQQMIGDFQLLVFVSAAIIFLLWFHRAHRNLPSLGAHNLQYTPGWAVFGFFVPFLNLVRPFQVARETWKASDPHSTDETSWQNLRTPSLLGWWWGMFLVTSLLRNIAGRMTFGGPDTVQGLVSSSWMNLVSDMVDIPAALLAIALVKGIDQRQQSKFELMSSAVTMSVNAGLQLQVDRLLQRGIFYSIFSLAGFGSLYSILLAKRAHRIIKESNGEIHGMGKVWWCYILGGLGVSAWFSILAVMILRNLP